MTSPQLIQDLTKRIAEKYKLSPKQMNAILSSVTDVTIEAMKSADREDGVFPSIRWIGFGLFYVPEKRIPVFKEFEPSYNYKDKVL
jgi:nucleoid DNA-binding protein